MIFDHEDRAAGAGRRDLFCGNRQWAAYADHFNVQALGLQDLPGFQRRDAHGAQGEQGGLIACPEMVGLTVAPA